MLYNKQIVNVGCGTFTGKEGNVLGVTRDSVGIELDSYAIKLSKTQDMNVDIVQADALFLPIRDRVFGYALCSEVIEHMKTEKEASQLARELGRVSWNAIITTPNSNFSIKIRDPTHSLFFTKKTLSKVLGGDWQIYTTRKTLPALLSYLLPYESPKVWFLHGFFRKLDYLIEFSWLNRIVFFIFRGAFLIACKRC